METHHVCEGARDEQSSERMNSSVCGLAWNKFLCLFSLCYFQCIFFAPLLENPRWNLVLTTMNNYKFLFTRGCAEWLQCDIMNLQKNLLVYSKRDNSSFLQQLFNSQKFVTDCEQLFRSGIKSFVWFGFWVLSTWKSCTHIFSPQNSTKVIPNFSSSYSKITSMQSNWMNQMKKHKKKNLQASNQCDEF